MQLDYANILRAGQNLVPDMQAQMMQRQRADMQAQQFDMQKMVFQQKQTEMQKQEARKAQFEQERDRVLASGNPKAIQQLMFQFPEYSEGIKPAWEAMDKEQRTADLTQMGSIFARANAGDFKGAASILQARVEADRAAGQSDPRDEAILAALNGDDPMQQRAAMAEIGMQIAAVEPDKFAEVYGKLNPTDSKTGVQKEYDWRVAQFGQTSADQWLAVQDTDLMAVERGGSIFDKRDFVNPARGGGGPASGGGIVATPQQEAESEALARRYGVEGVTVNDGPVRVPASDGGAIVKNLFPNARITQTRRDPNSSLGKASPGSYHNSTNAAVDVAPIKGVTFDEYLAKLRGAGHTIIEARDEVKNPSGHATGPHWHVVLGSGMPAVKSKQQYEKLESGTRYTAPDGTVRVKP